MSEAFAERWEAERERREVEELEALARLLRELLEPGECHRHGRSDPGYRAAT